MIVGEILIPKIIHYCWFGGGDFPDEARRCIDSWKECCPDYQIVEWNESNFDVTQNDYCREAYENNKWAFVSDYVRVKVLFEYGGIYMDTDVEVIKSYDNLLGTGVFCCFEDINKVSIGTLGAEKNHIFLQQIISLYENRQFKKIDGTLDMTPNLEIVTSILVDEYSLELNGKYQCLNNEVYVYPKDYFIAKSYRTGELEITNNTYAIHHYSWSWGEADKKSLHEEYKHIIVKMKWLPFMTVKSKIATIVANIKVYGIHGIFQLIKKKMENNAR